MLAAYRLEKSLENRKIKKYLVIYVHKDGELANQYTKYCIIEMYKDSLVCHKFLLELNGEISYVSKIIKDKETIDYVNYYANNHSKYSSKCWHYFHYDVYFGLHCRARWCKRKNIACSNNEWRVYYSELQDNGRYNFTKSFKSRLLNFRCLGLFKNLKSRKMHKKLMELLDG
jgi:hypothetical protein